MLELLRTNLVISEKLLEMHNVVDEDGVYRWYVRKSLERVVEQVHTTLLILVDLVKDNTVVMKSVSDLIKARLTVTRNG